MWKKMPTLEAILMVVPMTILVLCFGAIDEAAAPTLNPGDLLVVDNQYGVIQINPETGAQTVVSRGGYLNTVSNSARAIALEASGQILVTDATIALADGSIVGGVVRVNPATGAQTMLSSGGLLDDPHGVDVEANGDIVVTARAGVVRLDPVTGTQTLVSSGGYISGAQGLTVVRRGVK
jgi:hypothetical protein